MRTWTAIIEVRDGGKVTEFPAADSPADLLRDQTVAAVREAGVLIDPPGSPEYQSAQVSVILVKQTVARGAERDRTYSVFRDQHGVLRFY